jgi:hypothetical protein
MCGAEIAQRYVRTSLPTSLSSVRPLEGSSYTTPTSRQRLLITAHALSSSARVLDAESVVELEMVGGRWA